jgi:hypothetical protein
VPPPAAEPSPTVAATVSRPQSIPPLARPQPQEEELAQRAADLVVETVSGIREVTAPALPERGPESVLAPEDLRVVRSPQVRDELVARGGGNDGSEAAVTRALEWLARHQSADGRWDVDGFDAGCEGCASPGYHRQCDVAVTGLAVLCFLGQNHTPGSRSAYAPRVERALDWLIAGQSPDGLLARDDKDYTMYSHGIAALAISEACLMTGDPRFRPVLRRAVDVIVRAQNPTTGGWRYLARPPLRGDTSITGWQVMALASARAAGVEAPQTVFERARHWLDVEVAGGTAGGVYGYTSPVEPRVAMVAEGLFTRQVLGARRGEPAVEEAARYIAAQTQGARTHLDNLYLLYYGNLALYQYQGWIWETWNVRVRDHLVRRQHATGPRAGSWDPSGPWTESGGRVLATAFATLTLEVYYRYLPLYWAPTGSEGR